MIYFLPLAHCGSPENPAIWQKLQTNQWPTHPNVQTHFGLD
jgi:hypothetical protein